MLFHSLAMPSSAPLFSLIMSCLAVMCHGSGIRYRWQLKDVKFPPKRSLVLNKLNVAFIETRRAALENWWQALLSLDRIAEFNKHYASQPLKVW